MMVELNLNSSSSDDIEDDAMFMCQQSSFKLHFFITCVVHKDNIQSYLKGLKQVSSFPDISYHISAVCIKAIDALTNLRSDTLAVLRKEFYQICQYLSLGN